MNLVNLTDIKVFDSSDTMKFWEFGENSFARSGEWFAFEGILDGKSVGFDVFFDVEGTCRWYYEKGDQSCNEPDYVEQNDLDIYVTPTKFFVEGVEMEMDGSLSMSLGTLVREKLEKQ